jgi:SAM-dependent methyltransferase
MNWKHGYYADSGYTYGYYAETMPMRLHWAALVQNHALPIRQFRYLDAGCGQGYNLIMAAIAHPDSTFVGIDFLPEHIAHARALAERCGLRNIEFIEGDFVQLAKNPESLGDFDYVVCHGISTWIAPEVKSALFRLIGQILQPAGVFYNSYNTFPGWLGIVPFQHMVLLEQRSKTGTMALEAAKNNIQLLKEHSPKMFNALPGLQTRMNSLDKQDLAYLVQEYNNQFWQPVFVSQMMDELAAVKLSYLGTATTPEAFDAVLPAGVQAMLQKESSVAIREQLRDYASHQSFRRDLYVKGFQRPWPAARNEMIKATRFVACPDVKRPEAGEPFAIKGGSLELTVDAQFYHHVLDQLGQTPEGATVGDIIDAQESAAHKKGVVQALSLLLHAGYVQLQHEGLEAHRDSQRQATLAVAESVCLGAPYKAAPTPASGGAQALSDVEWVMLRELLQGTPEAQWPGRIMDNLKKLGRALAKEGRAVTEEAEQKKMIQSAIDHFVDKKAKSWTRIKP